MSVVAGERDDDELGKEFVAFCDVDDPEHPRAQRRSALAHHHEDAAF
ncbi:hypothetical protein [Rhodococcus sp. IEGM 1379]|nr:hypothetical protein [Rhodococcus sp. IEGM 1379]MDI9918364.1 hypothetical protein [Rhodococcus sp. IEGM 1379]